MRCISHTPQGGTTAVNVAGGALMVDQGHSCLFLLAVVCYSINGRVKLNIAGVRLA